MTIETATQTDLHPAALAAANWWADKAGIVTGNGDTGPDAGFTIALSVVAGVQGQTIAPSKREAFVTALARRITDALARQEGRSYVPQICIGVDYGPDPMLADAAREAGVHPGAFPWKTNSWTYPTHVSASLGYGGKAGLVWAAEDWERPLCGQGQWDLSTPRGGRLPMKCSGLLLHDEDHTFDTPDPLCTGSLDVNGTVEVCNRPADHEWHVPQDGYSSRLLHDFVDAG